MRDRTGKVIAPAGKCQLMDAFETMAQAVALLLQADGPESKIPPAAQSTSWQPNVQTSNLQPGHAIRQLECSIKFLTKQKQERR